MKITYNTAMEVASHEAIVRQAYKDSVGVWTWSVGLTSATGHNVERYIGKPQTMEHCLAIFAWALERYADDVRRAFGSRTLTEAQFAAALSFHWNTGAIGRATWVRQWLAGDVAAAKRSIMNWKTPAAIIPRRQKERDLFFSGRWSNNGTIIEYTRVRANGQPDWGSGVRVNVEKELKAALGVGRPPIPILPPAPEPPSKPPGIWAALRNLFAAIGRMFT